MWFFFALIIYFFAILFLKYSFNLNYFGSLQNYFFIFHFLFFIIHLFSFLFHLLIHFCLLLLNHFPHGSVMEVSFYCVMYRSMVAANRLKMSSGRIRRRFIKSRNITLFYECLLVLYIYKTFFKKGIQSQYIYERDVYV